MEDILRFDGDLNLAQGNLPPQDYDDARNIAIAEDDQGNAGSVKKLRSITEEYSFSGDVLATAIDDDGNQYFLHNEDSQFRFFLSFSSSGEASKFSVGDYISQTNGFIGVVYTISGSSISAICISPSVEVLVTGSNVYKGKEASGAVFSNLVFSSSLSSSENRVSISKVDTSGVDSYIISYTLDSTPTIQAPTLKIIGRTLVWNHYDDGTPLSFSIDDGYFLADQFGGERDISNIFLIKLVPDNLLITENTSANDNTFFNDNTITFAARYLYNNGEVSALSSYKTFIATPDRSAENFGVDGIESITVSVDPTGRHPKFAKYIQFYARVGNGAFRRIETKDITGGSTTTESITFTGQLSEALSTDDQTRLFDSVPLKAEAIETIKNRLFLGNIVDDLPLDNSTVFSVSLTGDSDIDWSSAVAPSDIDKPYFYPLSSEIVNDKVTGSPASGEFIANRNVLTNNSNYKIGFAFYDEFFRTRGISENSIQSFSTGLFDFPMRIKTLSFLITNPPSWAKYYKVLATRNLSKDFSIEAYADAIFYQIEDDDGSLYFSNFAPEGTVIDSVVIESGISYTFQQGDKVNLLVDDEIEQLSVKSAINGRIFCEPSNTSRFTYLNTSEKYFEVFSPKDATSEDSTIFYETGIGGLVTEATSSTKTISFPAIYDKTLLKDKIKAPIFSKTIDGDTEYQFLSEGSSREQDGLPVDIGNGALLYNTEDVQILTGGTAKVVNFNAIHTNDPAKTRLSCFLVNLPSHGYNVGSFQTVSSLGGDFYYEKVLDVINENEYIALRSILRISFVSTGDSMSVEDVVSVTTSSGERYDGCTVLGYTDNASTVNLYIGGLPLSSLQATSDRDQFLGGSVTNGAVTFNNATLAEYNYGGVDVGSKLVQYPVIYPSTDTKIYSGGGNFSSNNFDSVFGMGWGVNENLLFPPNQNSRLLRYEEQNLTSITFPQSSKKGVIVYNILLNVEQVSVLGVLTIYSNRQIGVSQRSLSVSSTGDYVFSGTLEVDLDQGGNSTFLMGLSGSITATFKKGSYIYGYFKGEESLQVPNFEAKERWGLSRKPNRRTNDDFTQDILQGKPSITDSGIAARDLEGKFRYGGRFVENSLINPISSFNSDDADFVPQEAGGITQLVRTNKLDSIGSVLLAICERETNSIYIGERLITNNDGSTSLAVSDSVVGSVQPLQGSRGCFHRKSIAKDQSGNVVWWDDFNKDFCRYSREGVVPISDYKVKSYTEGLSGEIITFFDKFYDTFFFHHVASGETISYHTELRWVGFHDMVFTLGGNQLDERSYPISGSTVYKTRGGDGIKYGSYFGSTADSYIQLSRFAPQNFEPRFLRMRGDLVDLSTYAVKSLALVMTNDNGQQTTLAEGYFSIDGSFIYSDIYMDENNGGIRDGIPMYGSNLKLKITLNSDEDDPHAVREVYLGYVDTTY